MFASLLSLVTAAVVVWQNSRIAVLWDLSYVLENATRIAQGDVPYRDFPFPYAPITFLKQAAIIRLFGRHYWMHIAYAVIAAAVATALTYAIARLLGCRPIVSFLLCAPLTFLGIYCILPHPFYDPDACLAILVAIFLFLVSKHPAVQGLAGFVAVSTMFIKQNIGLAFVAAVVLVVVLTRNWPALIGVVVAFAAAVVIVANTAGINNYIEWTVRFASQRRLPAMEDYFGIWIDDTLWWWLGVTGGFVVIAALVRKWELGEETAALMLLFASFPWMWAAYDFFTNDDPLAFEENLLRFWPLMLVVVWLRGKPAGTPTVAVAAILGAFLSQETWGSTYGIWPLLVILIAFTFRDAILPAIVIASVLLLHAVPYVLNDNRLAYAKVNDGALQHATLPALRGLSMRGPWIADFEQLVAWTDAHIPKDDAILCLPGEDLFYFTTGRRPRVPVLMFDRTVNPDPPEVIAKFPARWIIVKRTLQVNGTPMPELPRVLALMHPQLVARLRNYDVYQVGSPNATSAPPPRSSPPRPR